MNEYDEKTTPAICASCLGPNEHVSLRRVVDGAQCKLCTRPFTLFKWNATKFSKQRPDFKRTVICLTCARARNCCQCCMRDLLMGVSEQIKDRLVKEAGLGDIITTRGDVDVVQNAKTVVGWLYNANALQDKFSKEEAKQLTAEEREKLIDRLEQFVNTFQGYRHAKRGFKPLPKEQLVKLVADFPLNGNLSECPSDDKLKTFFLFGVNENTPIYSIRQYFEDLCDVTVEAICVSEDAKFGYVEFETRSQAEQAAQKVLKASAAQKKNKPQSPSAIMIDKTTVGVCWIHARDLSLPSKFTHAQLFNIGNVIEKQVKKLHVH